MSDSLLSLPRTGERQRIGHPQTVQEGKSLRNLRTPTGLGPWVCALAARPADGGVEFVQPARRDAEPPEKLQDHPSDEGEDKTPAREAAGRGHDLCPQLAKVPFSRQAVHEVQILEERQVAEAAD